MAGRAQETSRQAEEREIARRRERKRESERASERCQTQHARPHAHDTHLLYKTSCTKSLHPLLASTGSSLLPTPRSLLPTPRHLCPSLPPHRQPPPTLRAKLSLSSPLRVLPQTCHRCIPWFDPAGHSCTNLLTAASLRVEGGKDGGRTNDKEGQRRRESERARDRTGKMGAAKRQKVAVSTR